MPEISRSSARPLEGKMRRLTANKTKLYRLVSEFENLPPMRRVTFAKSFHQPDYWLRWDDKSGLVCEAFFAACAGRPILLIHKRAPGGPWTVSKTHSLELDELTRRGMVEQSRTDTA